MSSDEGQRGQRGRLDPDRIVDATLLLARDPDPAALSFRALGRHLGADPTAVYRHFRDKNALIEAALDRLLEDVAASVPPGLPWRERLRAVASAYFDVIVSHPGVGVQAGHLTTGGGGEQEVLEFILAALDEAGLSGRMLVRYYALLAAFAASMASAQAASLQHDEQRLPAQVKPWVRTSGAHNAARYPLVAALADEIADLQTEAVFRSGLELLLDAIEDAGARAAASAAADGSGA